MRIKKFLEFFDTEDLRNQHEIQYLSGTIKDMAKKVDHDFKTETLENFLQKISYQFPFMGAFIESSTNNVGYKKFTGFKTYINKDNKDSFWNFVVTDEDVFVVLGVKFNSVDNYDTYVLVEHSDSDDQEIFEKNNISTDQLNVVITYYFIEKLSQFNFDELINFNFDELKRKLN